MKLNREWNDKRSHTSLHLRQLSVYLHGGNVALAPDAYGANITELRINRSGNGVLLSKANDAAVPTSGVDLHHSEFRADSLAQGGISTSDDLDRDQGTSSQASQLTSAVRFNLTSPYPRSACFVVQNEVLRRFVTGDSKHGETDTRLMWAHVAITRQFDQAHNREGGADSNPEPCRTYIVSCDSDIPIVSLLCQEAKWITFGWR